MKGRAGLWVWAEVALREGKLTTLLSTLLSSAIMRMSVEPRDFHYVMLKEGEAVANSPANVYSSVKRRMSSIVFGSMAIKKRMGLGFVGAEAEDGPTTHPRCHVPGRYHKVNKPAVFYLHRSSDTE